MRISTLILVLCHLVVGDFRHQKLPIKKKGVFTVCNLARPLPAFSFPPYTNYVNPSSMEWTGFNYDLVQTILNHEPICKSAHQKDCNPPVEISTVQLTSYAAVLSGPAQGVCDMVIAPVPITYERRIYPFNLLYSVPYFTDSRVLVVKANHSDDTVEALCEDETKKIGVLLGTLSEKAVKAIKVCEASVVVKPSLVELLQEVSSGGLAGVVSEASAVQYFMENNEELDLIFAQTLDADQQLGFVFAKNKKGLTLTNFFNKRLCQIFAAGKYNVINQMWFDGAVTPAHPPVLCDYLEILQKPQKLPPPKNYKHHSDKHEDGYHDNHGYGDEDGYGSGYHDEYVDYHSEYVEHHSKDASGYKKDNYGYNNNDNYNQGYSKKSDYGKPLEHDYGYGKPLEHDYGYGKPDEHGYGSGKHDEHENGYGYGKPDENGYGYGKPDEHSYGYGKPDEHGYGYGKPDGYGVDEYGYGEHGSHKDKYEHGYDTAHGKKDDYGYKQTDHYDDGYAGPGYGKKDEYGHGYGMHKDEHRSGYGKKDDYDDHASYGQTDGYGGSVYWAAADGKKDDYGHGYGKKGDEYGYGKKGDEYGYDYGKKESRASGYGKKDNYGNNYGKKSEYGSGSYARKDDLISDYIKKNDYVSGYAGHNDHAYKSDEYSDYISGSSYGNHGTHDYTHYGNTHTSYDTSYGKGGYGKGGYGNTHTSYDTGYGKGDDYGKASTPLSHHKDEYGYPSRALQY